MKKYEIKIFWGIIVITLISACSSSDYILDEDYVPTDEDITETLAKVNTEWGTSKESILKHMKDYELIESSDENILQFNAKKAPITIAYKFSSDKLSSTVIKAKKGEDKLNIPNSLENFNHIGELNSNDIYSNEDKNVFAATYEITEDENNYYIIGFTPLHSMTENVNGKECADLGLSVKWATCNVGAKSPEDYGGYYAWGETEEKDTYTWSTYKYYSEESSSYEDIGDNISGTQYDVAQYIWGSPWTMPTKEEMDELRTKCDWIWTMEKGVNGYKVFGDNGNYIFMPAAGRKTTYSKGTGIIGYYMSATPYKVINNTYDLEFTNIKILTDDMPRCDGGSIRAILK